jgi:hypothetical protein
VRLFVFDYIFDELEHTLIDEVSGRRVVDSKLGPIR